jgi:hypothetical protein
MTNLEYNGVKIFGDDSEILLEKSLDGGFHHFHVCCGCHKVHEVTMRVKGEGQLLSSHWLLPHPKESAKIISELQSVTPDLIQYELANERAANEIEHLKRERDIAVLGGAKILLELGDSKTEVTTLRAKLATVCEAASATQRAFEEQAECDDCDAKAEAMGGRVDPLCDVCMERWAVSADALDDAITAAREGKK